MTSQPTPPMRQVADGRCIVSSFAGALTVLADPRLSNDPATGAHAHPDIFSLATITQRRGTSMQLCDGEQHTRLRRAVAAALSQRSYRVQLDLMKHRAEQRFADVVARGEGDLIADFVLPVVFGVICDLLGVPDIDRQQVHLWSDDSTLRDDDISGLGSGALDDYMSSLLAAKSENPADDLCSALAAARNAGKLTDAEAIGTASLMVVAGYETMVSFLGTTALTLLLAPRMAQLLAQRRELLPTALEELLRYITPTRASWTRFATSDLQVGEGVIQAGTAVVVDFASANRDPARFVSPERFDPTRSDNKHMSFGHGPHFCPGANLARRQALIVLDVLLDGLPMIELAISRAELVWHQNRFSRRPSALPVRVVS